MRGGYQIKWMDDTRALIVFEHPQTAKKAYIDNVNSPFIKVRPYKGQIEKKRKFVLYIIMWNIVSIFAFFFFLLKLRDQCLVVQSQQTW